MNLTLVSVLGPPATWVLRDPSGERRTFDDRGRLVIVEDSSGRRQTLTYDGTSVRPNRIRDEVSGRSLWPIWVGGRLATVAADPPAAGQAAPMWTYTYEGDRLTKVCSPLSADACTGFTYTDSSHYRSVVLDDNPDAYWPLGGTSPNLENVVARSPGENQAIAHGVTSGQPGPLAGSPDGGRGFTGAADSYVSLPDNLLSPSVAFSIELWFKAAAGKSGVLFGSQSVPIPTVPTSGWAPNLMIGTDGKLRGYQWTIGGSVSSAMISPGTVTDGQWHHTVLTMAVDKQTLYLDGDKIGEITGKIVDHRGMTRHFLGNGYTNSWPAAGTGYFPFTGQIDEVAFYRHPLSATQVAAHVTARAATSRLATVVEPGSFTATSATYDHASGRVTSMIDRNGATWTLGTPVVGDRVRLVTLSSTARDAITYTYDADHNGRLAVRTDGYGTADWEYNAAGFVYNYTDPDNQTRYFFTDNRGNRTADIVNYLGDWRYRYYGYMSFPDDPLDPRNDQLAWASDGRDSDTSTDFRTWYLRDTKGRVTNVVKPKLVGAPDWTARRDITYTNGTEPAIGGGTTPAGLVATDGNFSGGTTRYYYNSAGDRMKSVDPVGLTTEYTYDTLGRPLTSKVTGTVDGAVVDYGTTTTTYNAASLPETVTEPAVTNPLTSVAHTKRTRYTYDDGGRTTQIDESDLTGNDETRTTKTGYDPAGRIHSLTTADGKVTTQDWDEAGNLIRQTKPNGLVLEYGYDDHNHLVQTTAVGDGVDPMDPDATRMVVESRAYDPAGQLASVVDAMGRETAYTYYWTGLLETIKHVKRNTDGSIASTVLLDQRVYDYAGNLVRDTQAGGVVHDYLYDNLGNVIQDVLDPAGLARSTFYTRRGDGQPSATDATNGQAIGVGTPAEADLLYANNGSLIDRSNHRYADATTSFTYRFVLPPDATSASFTVEIDNQFLVETSTNNTSWTKVLEETRDIRDGSNRVVRTLDLSPTLATAKTIYVRFRDSQTATSWGARVIRSQLRFQRAGAPVESASFGYDTAGRPTSTTKIDPAATPKELVTTVTRDPRGLAMTTKDPAGAVTTFGYDRAGQLERTVEPPRPTFRDGTLTDNQSPTTLVGHDTFGEVTEQRDAADGSVTHIIRDQMGREHQRTLPSYSPPGGVTVMPVESIEYDDSGLPKSQKDALGRVTTYVHDKYGWLSSTTQPDPDGDGPKTAPVTQQKYNRVGEVLETIDPRGARVLATYDDQGIQVTETKSERVDGNTLYYTTTMVPDDRGRITSVTTPLSDKTTIDYNTADERTKVTDPDAVTTEFRYNATGRVTAGVTGGALATGYVFDSLGRNTAVTSHTVCGGVLSAPLRTATTGYDRDGRVVRETSAAGRITDYTYDAGGQVRTIAQRRVNDDESTAVSVKLDYDASGRRTRMIDGNEHATEYQYNSWGSPTAVVEPVTAAHPDAADQTWTTVYDTAGQATHILIPGSVTIDRSYDDLGQVIAETGSGAEGTTTARTFDYDAAGNITRAGTVGGDNTYEWNDRGLLTSTSGPGGTASFGYDSDGRLHTRTDGAGSTTFTYTDAGRLRTATDPLVSKTLTYTYRPATGDLQQITQGTGAPTRTFGYDALGRPASDTLTKANGAESAKITYGYDNDDLLTSSTTTGITGDGANGYGYDGLGRQTSWTKPGGATVTYGYDGASNRTSVTTTAGTRTFTFDARNRLTGASGGGDPDLTNTWSARGTLRSSTQDTAASTYTFDAFDQMLTAAEPGHTVEYRYDSLGRAATRNGVAFGYADQRNAPVNVPGDGAAPRGQIFRDPDSQPLSATLDGSPGRSLYQDTRHGDVRGWYDPSDGGLSRSAVYDPAGEVVAGSADRLPLGFQGGWSDPQTGLLNALSRWYDPGAPGFASRDTYTLSPDPVTQVNRYAYGNASPLNYIDVDGHNPLLLAAGFLFEVPVVGEAALVVVGVAAVGYIGYKAYQSYEYHHNVANSAGSWSGPATTTQPRTSVPDDYAARQQAAARAQAAVAAQQAATQARINAAVAAMNAAYNKWLAAYLAAVRAETARTAAEAARAYDIQLATEKAAAIKAATPGPVGTTVVKPPKVVALVGGAGTVTNTGATIQLPGTVYAGVDGADAPNTAAAAGAVAATNALQIAGGNNGDKDDDEVVEELAEWVDPDLINFSQRTVSPNNFAQSMRDGTWDWNRPGTALRVIERDGQLVSYDNRRLDAAREVRAEDPTYRVKIERLDPNALMPAKTTGMTWDQAFEKRMKRKRNWDENGCRVPWQGLFERPRWEE
jgi:RHS repeat-associated protein